MMGQWGVHSTPASADTGFRAFTGEWTSSEGPASVLEATAEVCFFPD